MGTEETLRVFISYSRTEQAFVRQLNDLLERHGTTVWVDWDDIRPTEDWLKAILVAIESADVFVFVITPESCSSRICQLEINHALTHAKKVVPLLRRTVDLQQVPEDLGPLQWITCAGDDITTPFSLLVSAFETDLPWVRSHTSYLEYPDFADSDRASRVKIDGSRRLLPVRPDQDDPEVVSDSEIIGSERQVFSLSFPSGETRALGMTRPLKETALPGDAQFSFVAGFLYRESTDDLLQRPDGRIERLTTSANYTAKAALFLAAVPGLRKGLNLTDVPPKRRPAAMRSDGSTLAVLAGQLVEVTQGKTVRTTKMDWPPDAVTSTQFTPDCRSVLAFFTSRAVGMFSADTGRASRMFPAPDAKVRTVTPSADGRFVFLFDETGAVTRWDAGAFGPDGWAASGQK